MQLYGGVSKKIESSRLQSKLLLFLLFQTFPPLPPSIGTWKYMTACMCCSSVTVSEGFKVLRRTLLENFIHSSGLCGKVGMYTISGIFYQLLMHSVRARNWCFLTFPWGKMKGRFGPSAPTFGETFQEHVAHVLVCIRVSVVRRVRFSLDGKRERFPMADTNHSNARHAKAKKWRYNSPEMRLGRGWRGDEGGPLPP